MRIRHLVRLALLFTGLIAAASPAAAQSSFIDLEVGYQWVDISGNQDMYRTQLNQDDGLVLNDLSIALLDSEGEVGIFDRFRIDATGFGGSPAGRFRLTSDLGDLYSLRLSYHQYQHFSALPGWANPFVDDGIVPGQHTWERDRDLLDLELEILPGRTITPIVGYRWNRIEGPRRTTYHVGQDEFLLDSDVEETEEEFRLGVAFRAGSWRGVLMQGWRDFSSEQLTRLAPGAGGGNNDRPVLGQDIMAESIGRNVRTKADTPVTTAHVSGGFGERVRLDLSYARAEWDSDTSSAEAVVGSLVSFRIARFFESLDQSISSRTESPSWRGAVRVGIDVSSRIALDLGYERRHRELEGWALISNLYMDTLNFSGADPRDISELVEARNGYDRDDDLLELAVRVNDLGPFFLWAEGSVVDTTLDVSRDVAEIVVPGGQFGSFDRSTDGYELGAGVDIGNLRVLVDYRGEDADNAIVRTDFLDRSAVRGRIDWSLSSWLRVLATIESIEADNDTPGIGLDAETDHWAFDIDLRPVESLVFRLAWDTYETESTTLVRIPHDFSTAFSEHTEEGEILEGSLEWRIAAFTLGAAYSTLDNEGVLPFQLDRAFGRLGCSFNDHWGAALEYENNDYTEKGFALADFDADRFGVFIRWRQ
jgi:hypothetical protein